MRVLVAGAHGFVGRALLPALVAAGHDVRAGVRRQAPAAGGAAVRSVRFDLDDPTTLAPALVDVDAVVWLVHGLQRPGFATWEQQVAARFVDVARAAGVRRLVYLGGVLPTVLAPGGRRPADPSPHLAARRTTGEILRGAAPHVLELRAGIVVGAGGASFRLLRDIAARAPLLVPLPWLRSEQQPVALDDVVAALVAAVDPPVGAELDGALDVPGPTIVTTEALLRMTAALLGRRVRFLDVPLPPALVIEAATRLTRADSAVIRGILGGAGAVDYVARGEGIYAALPTLVRTPLRVALRRALLDEEDTLAATAGAAAVEDALARVWR